MKKTRTYQHMKLELDEVVAKMQDETLDIDEATMLHEQGMKLVKELESYLKTAELTINKVTEKTQG